MRFVVARADSNGHGRVDRDEVVHPVPDQLYTYSNMFAGLLEMPEVDHDGAPHLPLDLPRGTARWITVDYTPYQRQDLHYTDSIDFDAVLSGSIDLLIDGGSYLLEAGDAAVIEGVSHAWRAGPQGCRLSVLFVGPVVSPPAAQARPVDQREGNESWQ